MCSYGAVIASVDFTSQLSFLSLYGTEDGGNCVTISSSYHHGSSFVLPLNSWTPHIMICVFFCHPVCDKAFFLGQLKLICL